MRSLKSIAADMRAMGEMLVAGAQELEAIGSLDAGALAMLGALFGGGGPAAVAAPTPSPRIVRPSPEADGPAPLVEGTGKRKRSGGPPLLLTKEQKETIRAQWAAEMAAGGQKEAVVRLMLARWKGLGRVQLSRVVYYKPETIQALNRARRAKAAERRAAQQSA